mmetsp:Transcript_35422/g.75507  ORF Transcript_35422/g.75507 Transcript_35422/m.75507 type:complete len:371 (+) Transcript_35422:248-1360(+)
MRRRGEGGVLSHFKEFDVYTKVHEDYRVRTQSGGLISLVSIITMGILFFSELEHYFNVDVVDHIVVDTTLDQKLPIGINITFPHLRCDEVSVDTVDNMGGNQVDVKGSLSKINLGQDGGPSDASSSAAEDEGFAVGCGPCLEAADFEPERCCNDCTELRQAYSDNGLPYYHILDTAPQCKNSIGCQIHGDVLVSKVGGNVHVALGKSRVRDGKHVHEFNIKEVGDGFNTSHSIHRLDFGKRVRGMQSPLSGTTKIVKNGAYMFHYYIKLVPTIFEGAGGEQVYTHQYSVSDAEKNVMARKGDLTGLPGVFLVYEFTPFLVHKVEKAIPLSSFLTSLCAIIGGVFTVAGMIDAILYRGYKQLRKGNQKGNL